MGCVSFVNLLWMLAPCGILTCIQGGFHFAYAFHHILIFILHVKCLIKILYDIFSLVWTPMSTKLWEFSCFLIWNMFGSLVVYSTQLARSTCAFLCLGHALHIATTCTHFCHPMPCHVLNNVFTSFFKTRKCVENTKACLDPPNFKVMAWLILH